MFSRAYLKASLANEAGVGWAKSSTSPYDAATLSDMLGKGISQLTSSIHVEPVNMIHKDDLQQHFLLQQDGGPISTNNDLATLCIPNLDSLAVYKYQCTTCWKLPCLSPTGRKRKLIHIPRKQNIIPS